MENSAPAAQTCRAFVVNLPVDRAGASVALTFRQALASITTAQIAFRRLSTKSREVPMVTHSYTPFR